MLILVAVMYSYYGLRGVIVIVVYDIGVYIVLVRFYSIPCGMSCIKK